MRISIITTAHWGADARLNRHLAYLTETGHLTRLESYADLSRWRALFAACWAILRGGSDIVILPDPELFVPGSILARLRGIKPVIDIHEDYGLVARGRDWVPRVLEPGVSLAARVAVALGRAIAWKTMTASAHLGGPDDIVVMNIPAPNSLPAPRSHDNRVVYVGDVTLARGASRLADLALSLPQGIAMSIIGRLDAPAREILEKAQKRDPSRLELTGRLPHREAWERSSAALAGLSLLEPLPAYLDAVATKIWEYMACGIPPVVTSIPGQAAVVSELDPELVCSSTEEMVAIIEELSVDSDRRRDLGERAQRIYAEAWERWRPDLGVQSVVEP